MLEYNLEEQPLRVERRMRRKGAESDLTGVLPRGHRGEVSCVKEQPQR